HLPIDAKASETRDNPHPAKTFLRMGNRTRIEHRSLEGLRRTDVGSRGALAHRDGQSGPADIGTTIRRNLAEPDQFVDELGIENRDVEHFASIYFAFQNRGNPEFCNELMGPP